MENFLPKNLKHLRLAKSIKQEALAKFLNCSISTVSSWENASAPKQPSIETLIRLSEYFDVSIDDMIKEDMSLFLSADEEKKGLQDVYQKIDYFEMDFSLFSSFSKTALLLAVFLIIAGFFTIWNEFFRIMVISSAVIYLIALCIRAFNFFFMKKTIILNFENELLFVNKLSKEYLLRSRTLYNIVLSMHMLLSSVLAALSAFYLLEVKIGFITILIPILPLINIILGVVFLVYSRKYYLKATKELDKKRFIPIYFLEICSMLCVYCSAMVFIYEKTGTAIQIKYTYLILTIISLITIGILRAVCLYIYSCYRPVVSKIKKPKKKSSTLKV